MVSAVAVGTTAPGLTLDETASSGIVFVVYDVPTVAVAAEIAVVDKFAADVDGVAASAA